MSRSICSHFTNLIFISCFLILACLSDVSAEGQTASLNISDGLQVVHEETSADAHHVGDSSTQYHPSFVEVDHRIIGRQAGSPVPTDLGNNQPQNYQLPPGSTLYYSFQAIATPQPSPRGALQDAVVHDGLRRRSEAPDEPAEEVNANHDGHVESREAALTERQSPTARQVWISINTCFMPNFTRPQDKLNPPQLSMAYRTARGPNSDAWRVMVLEEGFAAFSLSTDNSVTIQLTSPKADTGQQNAWNFDLAASRDGPYHAIDTTTPTSLKLIDSDPHAALLITDGLGNWTNEQNGSPIKLADGPPFGVFANNINYTGLVGLRNSYCALSQLAQIQGNPHASEAANNGVEMGLTHAQPSNKLEQQLYLPGLNHSSIYLGQFSIINGTYRNASVGGGGVLYPVMNFTTKSDENCAVIYNLTFCDQVNYAVPSNRARYSSSELAGLYDSTAQKMFQNFSHSLQQIPCNTTPSSQYSLAVNCTDCKNAYKSWLCAVTIPKCEDFSSNYNPTFLNWDGSPSAIPTNAYTYDPDPAPSTSNSLSSTSSSSSSETSSASRFQNDIPLASPQPHKIATNYLFPRNLAQKPVLNSSYDTSLIPGPDSLQQTWVATNSSRNNDTIAGLVQPGPYMEVLPCKDLCYDLVRMCPAALGFSCPAPGSWLEAVTYGTRNVGKDGAPTCNAPGAVYYPNAANKLGLSSLVIIAWVVGTAMLIDVL